MLIPASTILLSLAISLACCVAMARKGVHNGLLILSVAFILFAYGPAINIVRGDTFYVGINLASLTIPAIGFALASIGIFLAHKVVPIGTQTPDPKGRPDAALLPFITLVTAGYGAFQLVLTLAPLLGANKLVQIAAVGSFHYPYLLLQILVVCSYFLCRTLLAKQIWFLNLFVYVVYSLATSERDFLFVIIAILLHREIFLKKNRSVRFIVLAVLAAVAATLLATARQATRDGSLVSSLLNQGSILFIDSHLSEKVPAELPYLQGATYLQAFGRPLGFSDAAPLAEWFVSWYAPGSSSGYGFSLTGEAFLNFGLVGVPIVFFVLALIQRKLMNASGNADLPCYLSVVYLAALLYALRGDSAQIVSTMLYALVFYAIATCIRTPAPASRVSGEKSSVRR